MRRNAHPFARVYAIYPCTGGFTFALIEVRGRLLDSGKVDLGVDSDDELCERLYHELERRAPCVVAIEDFKNTKREERARGRAALASEIAGHLKIHCLAVDREAIRLGVGLPSTASRHEVATEISRVFPEIRHRLPRRSIWRRDPRLHVFMAIAMAWAVVTRSAGARSHR